jgi:hypothetical protein
MNRKSKKGLQLKTETLAVRLSPQTKFALELMARKQHRTLTLVVEWALQEVILNPNQGLGELYHKVWDPLEPDRFIKMALHCPELLTYEEQLLWKLICEEKYFCNGNDCENLYKYVRKQWDEELSKILDGSKQHNELGNWDLLLDEERQDEIQDLGVLRPSKKLTKKN